MTNGVLYTFELHAANDYGTSSAVSATATPQPPPTGTKGSVSLSPDPPQAGGSIIATLSDPDTPITGLRWRWFITTATGTADEELGVEEAVAGANGSLSSTPRPIGNSMVGKRLKARASYTDAFGAQTAESAYSSAVIAAPPTDTKGSVSLSTTSPQAGSTLTATLSDPDTPLTGVRWSLYARTPSAAEGQSELVEEQAVEGANGLPAKTWTVSSAWVGKQLQARVSYTDAFGAQTASSSYSSTVTAAPRTNTKGRVSLSTTAPRIGDTITATLSDPDTPITGLRWRWRTQASSGSEDVSEEVTATAGRTTSLRIVYTYLGLELRAEASYTDAFGAQTAESSYTSAVVAASGTAQDEDEDEDAEEAEDEEPETEAAAGPAEDEYAEDEQTEEGQGESEDEQAAAGPAEDEQTEEGEGAQTEGEDEQAAAGQGQGAQTEEAPAAKVALPAAALAARAAPNPFNPTTTLHVQLPASGPVRLTLYNVTGQVVLTLVDTALEAGYHTFYWDGRDQHGHSVTSGVYLYRLSAGKHVLVGKMALIR